MRIMFAPLAFLCFFIVQPAHAQGSPDSIYVPGQGYVEPWQLSGVKQARHFGTYTKSSKRSAKKSSTTRVAGKRFTPSPSVSFRSDATAWISEARRYKGMTGAQLGVKHRRLWCGEFMGKVARATGKPMPKNPNWAADWAEVGTRISGPQPGAIALIVRRGRIGHVGIVTGVDANGNPIIISGNHNDRVVETTYRKGSVVAYIWPS